MSKVLWVDNEDSFDDLLNEKELVVDFTAPSWCVPCQRLAPHFEKAAESSDQTFVAVDIDKAPWAVLRFGIQSVPTVARFYDGSWENEIKARTAVQILKEIA